MLVITSGYTFLPMRNQGNTQTLRTDDNQLNGDYQPIWTLTETGMCSIVTYIKCCNERVNKIKLKQIRFCLFNVFAKILS